MRNNILVVAFGSLALVGCDDIARKAAKQVMPAPIVMEWAPVYRPFSDNEAHVKIRNTGEGGYVKITVTDSGREWTERAYFSPGEERVVFMVLKGCTNFKSKNITCKAAASPG